LSFEVHMLQGLYKENLRNWTQ